MEEELREYRRDLQTLEQKSQESYDRSLIALSGGALGVSFAFVSGIIGAKHPAVPGFLVAAWVSWGSSVVCGLFSLFFSIRALRRAVDQVDDGTIYGQRPGGSYDLLTGILNLVGGSLFLLGVVLMCVFAASNMIAR